MHSFEGSYPLQSQHMTASELTIRKAGAEKLVQKSGCRKANSSTLKDRVARFRLAISLVDSVFAIDRQRVLVRKKPALRLSEMQADRVGRAAVR
jgi:hypothetical protein